MRLRQVSAQQKVTKIINQSLGVSPSEMSKNVVQTVSLESGVAAGVAAATNYSAFTSVNGVSSGMFSLFAEVRLDLEDPLPLGLEVPSADGLW